MDRWIDIKQLPKIKVLKNGHLEEIVDWQKAIGKSIPFKYGEIESVLLIKKYEGRMVTIFNPEYGEYEINVANLHKCTLGSYLKKFTTDYKIEIGQRFLDQKRDLVIIDRKKVTTPKTYQDKKRGKTRVFIKTDKYYLYHCNKDDHEAWILESNLEKGVGCALCSGLTVIEGKNDIATVRPELVQYFINKEDAKKYSEMSHTRVRFKCPLCGEENAMRVADLSKRGFSCPRCGDGFSYPEKFVNSCLSQSNISFVRQLSAKTFPWIKQYRYDFYLTDFNAIIEVHGEQHYTEKPGFSTRNIASVFENDEAKEKLALANGIEKYIIIDARNSELDWMKNHIEKSELSNYIDFSIINWKQCELDARNSALFEVCKIKKNSPELTSNQISTMVGIDRSVIVDYLKRGAKIGLVEYSTKKEMQGSAARNHPRKAVIVKNKNGEILGSYPSMMALEKESISTFGFKMHFSETAARCNPNSKKYQKPYHGLIIEEVKKEGN